MNFLSFACVTVFSRLPKAGGWEELVASFGLGQGDIPAVDWDGLAPALGLAGGAEWVAEYFASRGMDSRSLAEMTGLVVRIQE